MIQSKENVLHFEIIMVTRLYFDSSQLLVAVGRWRSTTSDHRTKREDRLQQSFHILKGIVTGQEDVVNSTKRIARKFCEHGGGV